MKMAKIAASIKAMAIPAAMAVNDVLSSRGTAAYTCITPVLIC